MYWINRQARDFACTFEAFNQLGHYTNNKTEFGRTVLRGQTVAIVVIATVLGIVIHVFCSELPARWPSSAIDRIGFKQAKRTRLARIFASRIE